MITAKILDDLPFIRHGFFTRENGFSSGLYESLNCGLGSGDDPAIVHRNRAYCARQLNTKPEHLVAMQQNHTADVAIVKTPWLPENAPVADGVVTQYSNIALSVLTADCTPVLLADPITGIIGAAHAGWKGAFIGVVEATVNAMINLGARASSIHAAVGPAIGFDSYEVGADLRSKFVSQDELNDRYFSESSKVGYFLFNLQLYVINSLNKAGVTKIEHIPSDTCAEEDRFFSYRRACLQNESNYGRQLSGIIKID